MRVRLIIPIALAAVFFCGQAAALEQQNKPVDLELILAVDVSKSTNTSRPKLQKQGYVAAFRNRRVAEAIQSGPQGRIAGTYVEWSGAKLQHVVLPWRVISSHEQALAFANDLEEQATTRTRRTSISAMLHNASKMFHPSGYDALRRVIDVSSDCPNNRGALVEQARMSYLNRALSLTVCPS